MIGPVDDRSADIPSALASQARWVRLGEGEVGGVGGVRGVPALLACPDSESGEPAPVVIWMHGRTVQKETDPGRYLRWLRAGIGACSVDLPGHGERYDAALQAPARGLEVIRQMVAEIDQIVTVLRQMPAVDADRLALGGMSLGGMVALVRLCRPHPFRCASVEATTGSWEHQRHGPGFRDCTRQEIDELNPIRHLDGWREIPFQAIHTRSDEWVAVDGQVAFIGALEQRYRDGNSIEFVQYDQTGALYEHAGFGRMAADAKDRQRDFFRRWLIDEVA